MVASPECDKPKAMSATKVSKPLMEKKRRARINQCLDQLKSLLESHYSSSIRKRKLEKADILELTVKHLKHLQKIQKYSSVAPEPDQMGFRSCVTNINHYLLTTDHLSGPDRWKLSQLTSRLGSGRPEECGSTMDSGLSHAQTQDVTRRLPSSPVGPEESNTVPCNVYSPATEHALPRKHGQPFSGATKTATPKIHREVVNSVWRPW